MCWYSLWDQGQSPVGEVLRDAKGSWERQGWRAVERWSTVKGRRFEEGCQPRSGDTLAVGRMMGERERGWIDERSLKVRMGERQWRR